MDADAAKRIKNELLQKMKDMSDTLADSYSDFAHGKPVFCDASVVQSRMAYCNACEHYTSLKICKACKCFIPLKAKLRRTKCPLGKWEKIDGYDEKRNGLVKSKSL